VINVVIDYSSYVTINCRLDKGFLRIMKISIRWGEKSVIAVNVEKILFSILFIVAGFLVFRVVRASAPNPGHTWADIGDVAVTTAQGGTGWASLQANTVLLGNGTSAIATTSAGTGGFVLALSNGIPTWVATTTLANISGTLGLSNGGTAASLAASNGGIVYSGSSAFAVLGGTATANKVLVSGASTAPTWSTPTFPNASATARKIIVSDGTNWVASTETHATPSTAGNLMESDGTNWVSAAGGVLINKQIFTSGSSATYTPTAGTNKIVVQMWGGGGAGGSCTAVAGCACGGGGSGGYALYYLSGVSGTYTYSVGTAGAASAGAAGGNGGNTTFVNGATTVTAFGGTGGGFIAGTAATKYTAGGAGGVISTNGTINSAGAPGGWGSTSATATIGGTGAGGSTALGGGGVGVVYSTAAAAAGVAAVANTGSGGSGGGTGTTSTAAGGAGAAGLIIIWEYR